MYTYSRRAPRAKTALLKDGPVGRVLSKAWNTLHDIEGELEQTLREYDDAAHFMGGPAERDAEKMIQKIQSCVKELRRVSSEDFSELVDAEADFVKKFGEPGKYADEMRNKTFPR